MNCQPPISKRSFFFIWLAIAITVFPATARAQNLTRKNLFTTDSILSISIAANFSEVYKTPEGNFSSACLTLQLQGYSIADSIRIRPRGVQRKNICITPPLMLDCRQASVPVIKKLGKLKLVRGCGKNKKDEELILKEYLVYKMYNQLNEKSFRVRLLHVYYHDTDDPARSYTQYGFFIEDTDDMAARNNCREQNTGVATESTNRKNTTLVSIFQYMIGNTDWTVPLLKNIKLIAPLDKPAAAPFVVPYDFDYSGIVDAAYAVPHPDYNIDNVKERVYKGFPRNQLEINMVIDTLVSCRKTFNTLINNFNLLDQNIKKKMTGYLDEFYQLVSDPAKTKEIFIDNARTE